MTKLKIKAKAITELLLKTYPEASCTLDFENPFELLVATRLSAQCTDKRVNIVCGDLFIKYKSIADFAAADIFELENVIKPCGFYHTKAKSIIETANILIDKFGGEIPKDMDSLLTLSGVGRKSANLILGELYGYNGIVVDTHCIRLCNRLGLVEVKDPFKIEKALQELIDGDKTMHFCHSLVLHGRQVCSARKPLCDGCVLEELCSRRGVG